MNNLLHSKRFKKNLSKWLMMYVCSLGMLTMVVTYSKYITTYNSTADEARVAKFDVDMTTNHVCENNDCSMRPEEYVTYDFTIDATKSEVDITSIITITIDPNFEFVELTPNDISQAYTKEIDANNNAIKLTQDINKLSSSSYTIKLRYKEYNTEAYKSAINYDNILKVDYAATQIS